MAFPIIVVTCLIPDRSLTTLTKNNSVEYSLVSTALVSSSLVSLKSSSQVGQCGTAHQVPRRECACPWTHVMFEFGTGHFSTLSCLSHLLIFCLLSLSCHNKTPKRPKDYFEKNSLYSNGSICSTDPHRKAVEKALSQGSVSDQIWNRYITAAICIGAITIIIRVTYL